MASGSGLGDLAGWGRGVFSGSAVDFFFPVDLSFADLLWELDFFLLVFDFAVAGEGVAELDVFFGRGVELSSSSESDAGEGDFFFAGEFFLVSPSSDLRDFDLVGVLPGRGDGAFLFFGDGVGVGVDDFE